MPLLMINDVCVVKIEKESREWGYNPVDDNTEVVIVAFGSIYHGRTTLYDSMEPGLYLNDSYPIVRKSDGTLLSINSCYLSLKNKKLENERRKEKKFFKKIKIQDLPETPFYEMDVVKIKGNEEIATISRIDYQCLNSFCNDKVTPYSCYGLNLRCGVYTYRNADDIELVKRGNVWNEFHNLPLVFNSLSEEAEYAKQRGKYVEVKNPKLNLYSWNDPKDIVEAIQNKIVHGIVSSSGFFGLGNSITAIKFHDEDLGNRVSKVTLEILNEKIGNR
jgi:hypothetical protein